MTEAHAQDFERKRRPEVGAGAAGAGAQASPHHSAKRHVVESSDDEDEDEDEEEEEEVEEARAIVDEAGDGLSNDAAIIAADSEGRGEDDLERAQGGVRRRRSSAGV